MLCVMCNRCSCAQCADLRVFCLNFGAVLARKLGSLTRVVTGMICSMHLNAERLDFFLPGKRK